MKKFATIEEVAGSMAAVAGAKGVKRAWNGSMLVFKAELANGEEVIVSVVSAEPRTKAK